MYRIRLGAIPSTFTGSSITADRLDALRAGASASIAEIASLAILLGKPLSALAERIEQPAPVAVFA